MRETYFGMLYIIYYILWHECYAYVVQANGYVAPSITARWALRWAFGWGRRCVVCPEDRRGLVGQLAR